MISDRLESVQRGSISRQLSMLADIAYQSRLALDEPGRATVRRGVRACKQTSDKTPFGLSLYPTLVQMITTHQYLAQYPVDPNSEKLIAGTIHPHNHEDFTVKFFYGNQCSLWKIMHAAFPDELRDPFHLNSILAFLQRRKIAMSDMIRECERTTPAALDRDLIPTVLNEELPHEIRHSNIREIFFTSGFGKNAAFQLFYKNVLGERITPAIRTNREVTLPPEILGRPMRLRILYSPSGTANTGLVRSADYRALADRYRHLPAPVQAFKVDYYREMFGSLLD